jgi:hypothetical protein
VRFRGGGRSVGDEICKFYGGKGSVRRNSDSPAWHGPDLSTIDAAMFGVTECARTLLVTAT